jgi:hypothetical protein
VFDDGALVIGKINRPGQVYELLVELPGLLLFPDPVFDSPEPPVQVLELEEFGRFRPYPRLIKGLPQDVVFPAHVPQLVLVPDPFQLDLKDGYLIYQLARGNLDAHLCLLALPRKQPPGDLLEHLLGGNALHARHRFTRLVSPIRVIARRA